MNEKNGFLYKVVDLFEGGNRALSHNNFGAHVWTPELGARFGARKGDPLPNQPNLYTAYYEDPETGRMASNYIIDKIWDETGQDTLKFVTRYTGLQPDNETVSNYVRTIQQAQAEQNYQGAVVRVKNRDKLLKQKEKLYSEFPNQEKKIDKLIETGQHTADGIRNEIAKVNPDQEKSDYETFKNDVLTALDISDDEIEGAKNAFLRGYGNLKTMTNVLGYQLGINPEERVRQIAIEQSKLEDLPASETFDKAMNPENDFGQTLKELKADPIAVTAQLATESLTQFLPAGIAVGVPVMVGGAVVGAPIALSIATTSFITSLGIEWASEILGSFSQQGVNVKDPDQLAEAFTNEEINSKAQQEALEKGVPVAVFDAISGGVAGRYLKMAKGMGLTRNLSALGKEILTQAGLGGTGEAIGQLVALDPEEGEQINIPAIVAESVVEIGTGAVAGTVRLTFDNGNSIEVPENDPLVQDIITAKTKQYQKPTTEVETEYAGRVSQLTNYKDKIGIGFSELPIEDVFTEQQLIDANYNPSQFENEQIKEGEDGYVDDDVKRYRIPVQATNYEFGDGTRRVLLSKEATQADFLEDTAEAVFSRMGEVNAELKADIDGWIAGVQNEAQLNNESLPYTGEELFSKAFIRGLGYDVALPDYAVLPESLNESFKAELILDDGTNLIDGFEISDNIPDASQAVNYEPVEVSKETKSGQIELFSLGSRGEGGIFVMGGDAIARDAKGRRSVEGIRYPEKYSGWQLSERGATALENLAKAGNDVIVIYQYPKESSSQSNPRFKEVFELEKKKNARKAKKNRKTLKQLRIDVERMVSEPDVNLNRGKVLYVAQFDKILRGDERTKKHDTYPAQVVFKNVRELSRPFNIETLTNTIDPSVSKNAQTFMKYRDLRATSSNAYVVPSESVMVEELRAFSEGKPSVFDARMDSDKVMATFRRKGETTVEGVFESINSERELRYFGILADVAKDINLNGRHAQAGAVTNKFGKENSMVFTVENPDQNALDLYIAYAGLLGDQYQVMHFKPDNNGSDLVYETSFPITDQQGVIEISNNLNDIGIDHTIEIRGNTGKIIIIDLGDKIALDLQDKGVIDDTTTATRGSITFEGVEENESLSEKQNRKNSRDYWDSEVNRLEKEGYVSETGKQAYSNLQSQLERGEGFSLGKAQEKEYAKAFNKKVTRREARNARRDERINKPRQIRDLFKSISSQLSRINPKLAERLRRYQKRESDLLDAYLKAVTPFGKTLKKLKKKAKSRKKKAEYVALKLALYNGDTATVELILKSKRRISQYRAFQQAHKNLHEQAMAVGVDIGHIENHFPREVVDYRAFFKYVSGITASAKQSKLQEAFNDARSKRGRDLTDEEKMAIANILLRQQKGLLNSSTKWTQSRKIDQLTVDQLRFYDEPHNTLARYGSGMAKKIAVAQFLGGRPNRYSVRVLPKNTKIKGVGIYDHRVKRFILNEKNGLLVYKNRKSPAIQKAMEQLRIEEQGRTGLPYMGLEDQVGSMILDLQSEYKLNNDQTERVRELLTTYFKDDSMHPLWSGVRSIGYISTMGSVFSAVTQLGDLGVAVYRSSKGKRLGLIRPSTYTNVLGEMFKSITRLNKYKLKQLGVDNRILQELSDNQTSLQRAMTWVFRLSGLTTMDRAGKETYVNTVMKNFEKGAKQIQRGKNNKLTRDIQRRIKRKFNDKEYAQLIQELSTGKRTELTTLLAYSELLDVQPVARSEVPVGYLRHPNGRIFYMLKTFMLKRFDVFVNETNMLKKEGKHASAIMNMVMLGTVLAMAEASADTIKDWMAGRKTDLDELVVSNLLKLAGISRYHYYNFINSKTSQAIIKMLIPPVDYIDDPISDIQFLHRRLDKYKNTRTPAKYAWRDFQKRGAKWIRHIPIAGKHLYWKDGDTDWIGQDFAKVIDKYAPFMSTGYGKRVLEERKKRERNK